MTRKPDFHVPEAEDFDGPHPQFAELRSRCPVAWSDDLGGFWAVTSHSLPPGPGDETNRGAFDENPTKGSSVFCAGLKPKMAKVPSRSSKKIRMDASGRASACQSGTRRGALTGTSGLLDEVV